MFYSGFALGIITTIVAIALGKVVYYFIVRDIKRHLPEGINHDR